MSRLRASSPWPPLVLVAAALALGVAGCGDGAPSGAVEPPPIPPVRAGETAEIAVERVVIGRWHDARPLVGGTLALVRVDGELMLEQTFDLDGSVLRYELVETDSPLGRRFDPEGDATTSDLHWVITPEGDLQIRDRLGLSATARAE